MKATGDEDWVLIPYDVLFLFTQDFVYTFSVVIDVASKTTWQMKPRQCVIYPLIYMFKIPMFLQVVCAINFAACDS